MIGQTCSIMVPSSWSVLYLANLLCSCRPTVVSKVSIIICLCFIILIIFHYTMFYILIYAKSASSIIESSMNFVRFNFTADSFLVDVEKRAGLYKSVCLLQFARIDDLYLSS